MANNLGCLFISSFVAAILFHPHTHLWNMEFGEVGALWRPWWMGRIVWKIGVGSASTGQIQQDDCVKGEDAHW